MEALLQLEATFLPSSSLWGQFWLQLGQVTQQLLLTTVQYFLDGGGGRGHGQGKGVHGATFEIFLGKLNFPS